MSIFIDCDEPIGFIFSLFEEDELVVFVVVVCEFVSFVEFSLLEDVLFVDESVSLEDV